MLRQTLLHFIVYSCDARKGSFRVHVGPMGMEQKLRGMSCTSSLLQHAILKITARFVNHVLFLNACRYLCMGLSVERRTELGRRCKLLLDTARARYLSAKLNSRLVYFITPDVTPENVAILATANAL